MTGSGPGEPAPGPLAGLRVIECGSLIAGPFCGQLLGDFGAEVIKVEDPVGGDPMREWGLKVDGLSLHWPVIGRNKKSVTADLRHPEGQALLRGLAARSDILIENFRPGTLERWGLGPDLLMEQNPRLIVVRVSGFGQSGPYSGRAGFGSIGEAMGGLRHLIGDPDRPPARAGISLGDSLAGTMAALGTLAAVVARQSSGRGQVVDTAIYEAVLTFMESALPEWHLGGHQRERTGAVLPGVAPSNVYPTGDGGDILIAANRDTVFSRLAAVMGRPDLATDARFATHDARGAHQAELDGIIAGWTATAPAGELLDRLEEGGVPAGRIYRSADMLADPHFSARQAIVRLLHPELGPFPMQNVAPQLSATPGTVRSLAPALGEDTDRVYRDLLGIDAVRLEVLREAGVI